MRFRPPDIRTIFIVGFAATLLALGLVFVVRSAVGAVIFGLPTHHTLALQYVAALGFRDLSLGLTLMLVSLFSTRRTVGVVLAGAALIPLCDVLLVILQRKASSGGPLVLHSASAIILIALAVWSLRRS